MAGVPTKPFMTGQHLISLPAPWATGQGQTSRSPAATSAKRLETRVGRAVSIDGAMPSATERTHAEADLGRAGQAGGALVPACARRASIESLSRGGFPVKSEGTPRRRGGFNPATSGPGTSGQVSIREGYLKRSVWSPCISTRPRHVQPYGNPVNGANAGHPRSDWVISCHSPRPPARQQSAHDPAVPASGLSASLRSSWIRMGQVHGHAYPIDTRPETRISRGGAQIARC